VRVRRNLPTNSDIGVIVLNKETTGSHFNRTVGADANLRFGFLSVDGFIARTFSPSTVAIGTGNEYAGRANINYSGRRWQLTQT
jgi:hypothetical protein